MKFSVKPSQAAGVPFLEPSAKQVYTLLLKRDQGKLTFLSTRTQPYNPSSVHKNNLYLCSTRAGGIEWQDPDLSACCYACRTCE